MCFFFSRRATALAASLVMSACVSYDPQQGMRLSAQDTAAFTGDSLTLATTESQRMQRAALTRQLLNAPVGQKQAVDLMLVNSAAFQGLLAQHWASAASIAQSGRIPNPSVAIERVVTGNETELNALLTFGLLDVLTLPQRADLARLKLVQAQIRLSADVVDQVTQVRQAWVRAVAANEMLTYAEQVAQAAQASDTLAERMKAAGNFNALTRNRHQLFHAQAQMQLAVAQQNRLSRTEALVRLLGLDAQQAAQLKLPESLPALPEHAVDIQVAATQASQQRLDIRMAQAELQTAAKAQGLTGVTSWTDIELTVLSGKVSSAGSDTSRNGAQISIKLPVFDSGNMQRAQMNAQTLAAANQLQATAQQAVSTLREAHAAYLTSYSIAKRYKEELLPLRQRIADENLLRYNAMQIGVFDLLTDAAEQSNTVAASLDALQQFWLSEAALQSTLMGRPLTTVLSVNATKGSSEAAH